MLALALLVHLVNLSGFPAFFIDEGAYISRGVSFSQNGDPTSPNGTFYFHPFLAWILLGLFFRLFNFPLLWTSSPGLLYLFPRTILVVMGVVDVAVLYLVVSRVYGRRDYALLSSGLLAVTPLSVRYLRMVLLDSFVLFFVLISLLLLVKYPGRKGTILSGTVFGMAVLSKLPALFFILPVVLWTLSRTPIRFSPSRTEIALRLHTAFLWTLPIAGVALVWPGYAVVTDQWSGFLAALSYQGSREEALALNLILSRILERDPFLLVGLASVGYGIVKRDILGGLFTLAYLGAFVLSGLRVSSYYLVPALPFLSVLAARVVIDGVGALTRILSRMRFHIPAISLKIVCALLVAILASQGFVTATQQASASQIDAIDYVVRNAPGGALVISNPAYSWVIQVSRANLIVYDWFSAPWSSLPSLPKTYLIVDPGFTATASRIPPLQDLYNQTSTETTFSNGGMMIEIRTR